MRGHNAGSGTKRNRAGPIPRCARWFPADEVQAPEARYLDIILYSREQLLKEYEALPSAEKSGEASSRMKNNGASHG